MAPRSLRPPLIGVAVALFAAGVLAIVVVFGIALSGAAGLPVWLPSAAGGVTAAGLALGLIALLREARGSRGAADS
ncbi:MAG: hypothetical protein ACRDRN_11015 [Sciscionella sp.]